MPARDAKMHCFRVEVETTNSMGDTFVLDRKVGTKVGRDYQICEDGSVYVFAKSMADATRQIPNALKVERVGVAFTGDEE